MSGFGVADVGGNWLRISKAGVAETRGADAEMTGRVKIAAAAARLGDAPGDDAKALNALEGGLRRYPGAPAVDRARALLSRTELAVRLGDGPLAKASLTAVHSPEVDEETAGSIADEMTRAAELVSSHAAQ